MRPEEAKILKIHSEDKCLFCEANPPLYESKIYDYGYSIYSCNNCQTHIEFDGDQLQWLTIGINESTSAFLKTNNGGVVLCLSNDPLMIPIINLETLENFVLFIKKLRNNSSLM